MRKILVAAKNIQRKKAGRPHRRTEEKQFLGLRGRFVGGNEISELLAKVRRSYGGYTNNSQRKLAGN